MKVPRGQEGPHLKCKDCISEKKIRKTVSAWPLDFSVNPCRSTNITMNEIKPLVLTLLKRVMNQLKEYWYIGSMFARSEMVKNNILLCLATCNNCAQFQTV